MIIIGLDTKYYRQLFAADAKVCCGLEYVKRFLLQFWAKIDKNEWIFARMYCTDS